MRIGSKQDGEHAERTTEQKELEAKGLIFVAWDLHSCLLAVATYERAQLGIEPLRDVTAYLAAKEAVRGK